ncbi:MAG: UxaA family hydrolase [Oscillospiraceae bacterium]
MINTEHIHKELSHVSWQGYLRKNGRIGIRNKVLIIYTVECASHVAKHIAGEINVDDVDVIGFYGCCDNEYAVRMLIAMIRHPNIGAVLAVGLGCEYVQAEKLRDIARSEGKPSESILIQQSGGTRSSIDLGKQLVNTMLCEIRSVPRGVMKVSDLVIGAECGGSDYTSGLAGNAVVGRMFDHLVDLGGTAIFEELMEAVGLRDYLSGRAADETVAEEIKWAYDKMVDHCKTIRQYGISPGNFMGGLSTIEEKSMGAVVKSGSRPIVGLTKVSVPPKKPGLWLLDSVPDPYYMGFGKTNPNDSEGLMDLISCGCHLVIFITGRGSVIGSPISPTYKVTGNSATYENLSDDLDFNAGLCITEGRSPDEMGSKLLRAVIDCCKGERSRAELHGHKEYLIPYKYQDIENYLPPCKNI